MNLSSSRRALLAAALLSIGAAMTPARAQAVLRITTIPEEAATEQVRKFTPIASYLEKKLGL